MSARRTSPRGVQARHRAGARRGDLTHAEVAAGFDVSVEPVRRWYRQAAVYDGVVDGEATAEQNELAIMRRGARRLERALDAPERQAAC